MVVTDDEIDAERVGVLHLIDRFDTAVECDDEGAAFLFGGVDSFGRDTIALGVTVGDIIDEVVRLGLEEGVHECDRRGAVHIVIAIDHDPFVGIDGLTETIHSGSHVLHKEGVVQTIQ